MTIRDGRPDDLTTTLEFNTAMARETEGGVLRPQAWKQGVYRALGKAVERLAKEKDDVCGVRLYVIRDNAAARAVYEKMGMTCTGYRLYEKEF